MGGGGDGEGGGELSESDKLIWMEKIQRNGKLYGGKRKVRALLCAFAYVPLKCAKQIKCGGRPISQRETV